MSEIVNFAMISDGDKEASSLKRVLETEFSSAQVKTYRFNDFSPAEYGTDFDNIINPIVIIIGSSISDYDREVNLIQRLRISRDLKDDAPKVPIILLTYENILDLIRRYPSGVLFLSEGCTVVQIPFKKDYLFQQISNAEHVKDLNRLKDFLIPESRLAQIEKLDKHGLANYLGPPRLLRGAYLSGEFGKVGSEEAKKLYNDTMKNLKQKQNSIDYYGEYLDLQEAFPFTIETEDKERKEQKGKRILSRRFQGLHTLLIDDEHEKGWSDVIKELLLPNIKWNSQDDYIWSAEDRATGTKLECVAKVGESEKIDDLGKIYELLKLNDSNRKWIDYNLILLDLRLKKESPKLSVKETSGYLLLKAIREKDLTVPVIMFTASEKAATLRTLQKLGISGYFIKELPRGDDNFSRMNFEVLRQSMLSATKKYYLRDIWFNTILLKEILLQKGKNKKYFNLLDAAYFKISGASPENPINSYDYNMAVILYHQCLDLYTAYDANLSKAIRNAEMIKRIEGLRDPSKKEVAKRLNELRNEIIHRDKIADEGDAACAFLWIGYILSDHELPRCKFSQGFTKYLYTFCNTLPQLAKTSKEKELDIKNPGSEEISEDSKIIQLIQNVLKRDVTKIEIQRSAKGIQVFIYTTNPGKVIGPKGSGIKRLKELVQQHTDGEIRFMVKERIKP